MTDLVKDDAPTGQSAIGIPMDMLQKLRGIVKPNGLIESAQVQIVGLDDMQQQSGVEWPVLRDRLRTSSQRVISQHLHRNDLVLPAGDGFLIFYADTENVAMATRCREIQKSLAVHYSDQAYNLIQARIQPNQIAAEQIGAMLRTTPACRLTKPSREVLPQSDLKTRRIPIWLMSRRAVAADLYAPNIGGASDYVGYNPHFLARPDHGRRDYLAHDLAVLHNALIAHDKAAAEGIQRQIFLQVHATTLQNRRLRENYLSWLPAPVDAFMQSSALSIAEITRGTPTICLTDWMALLRRHFHRISLDFHLTDHATGVLSTLGAWGASVHLPLQIAAQEPRYHRQILEHIKFWVSELKQRRMRLIVHGFKNAQLADEAMRIGVEFATGEVLSPQPAEGLEAEAQSDEAGSAHNV